MKPYYKTDKAVIYHSECQAVLAEPHDLRMFGALISDPPWWGFEYAVMVEQGVREYKATEEAIWIAKVQRFYSEWLPQVALMTNLSMGRAFFWASPHHFPAFSRMALLAGWPTRRVWYAPENEVLMQFGRPITEDQNAAVADAFQHSPHRPVKDDAMLEAVLAASHGPVFDPFMGTGSTLIAAVKAGRHATGVECKEEVCEQAAKALEALG